jgi:hypothetical protein
MSIAVLAEFAVRDDQQEVRPKSIWDFGNDPLKGRNGVLIMPRQYVGTPPYPSTKIMAGRIEARPLFDSGERLGGSPNSIQRDGEESESDAAI